MQIDQRPQAFACNATEGTFECGMAFASGRAKDVAHQAVGVHAYEHRLLRVLDIAANEGDMRLAAIDFARIRDETKFTESRLDQGLAYAIHIALMRHAVADQLGYREHLHVVLAAELDEVGHAGHR